MISHRFRIIWLLLFLFVSINGCKKKALFKKPIKAQEIEVIMENVPVNEEGEDEGDDEENGEGTGEEEEEENTVEIVKYTITIYVDQPGTGGDREKFEMGFTFDAGHAFIKLETEDANGNKNAIIVGFYPIRYPHPNSPEIDGHISDDSEKEADGEYEVSKTWEVTRENFIKAKDYIEGIRSSKKKYHLNDYNCADFVIQTGKAAGIDVPDTQATWEYESDMTGRLSGHGSSPGDLGEDLREP